MRNQETQGKALKQEKQNPKVYCIKENTLLLEKQM